MKRIILAVSLVVIVLFQAVVSSADEATKQQIKAEYMKGIAAVRNRDIKGIMLRYTNDFKRIQPGRKTFTRADVEDSVDFQLIATKEVKELSFAIQSVTVKGAKVTVNVKQKVNIIIVLHKIQHTVVSNETSVDTWIKTDAGWRLQLQEVKENTTTEDGKTVKSISKLTMPMGEKPRVA